MDKHTKFYEKARTQAVYWKNTVDTVMAVFKLTPEGDTYTKLEGSGGEFKSNNSKMAQDSRIEDLREITEQEYKEFPRNWRQLFQGIIEVF